jgi:hypothetical protein
MSSVFIRESLRAYIGASVSRALDSRIIGRNYLTSRINWVVQSTAVDFLHLLLVAVHWLFHTMNIKAGLFFTYVLPTSQKSREKSRNFHVRRAEKFVIGGWRLCLVPRSRSPSCRDIPVLFCFFIRNVGLIIYLVPTNTLNFLSISGSGFAFSLSEGVFTACSNKKYSWSIRYRTSMHVCSWGKSSVDTDATVKFSY